MRTFVFKMYRAARNRKLHKRIGIACDIYNHCIALHRRYYRMFGKYLNMYRLQAHLAKLKKRKRHAYWNGLGSQAIQNVTERIDRAYKLFFANLRRGVRTAPPSFKKKRKYRSFTLKQKAGWKIGDGNTIVIDKQEYRYHKSREIEGTVKTVTVKRDALGDLYVYFVCGDENEAANRIPTGNSAGFDFGLKTFLVSSDGDDIVSPLFFKQNANAVKQANRNLSRKKKGSKNRAKARLDLARVHKNVSNQRKDWQFKLARRLCETYDVICVEDLNIKGMQRLWGCRISDLGHAQFVTILKWMAEKLGSTVVEIPRFYPSSKTCSSCGHVLASLDLSTREWTCPACGMHHDRDRNAAINIHRVGASTCTRGEVRPSQHGLPPLVV